jgi:hypothetical protein
MKYRFTLSHDAFPDKVISEPQGFDQAQLKLVRHEDFHSLIEYYEGEFIFYGADQFDDGGIDYIREVDSAYGHDTDLRITIEVAPDGYTFETLFVGLLKLAELEELPDNKMQVPVIRDDFWSKFINRQETQVDIQSQTNLDNTSADQFDSVNLRMSSQTIRKRYYGQWNEGENTLIVPNPSGDTYLQITPPDISLDEIDEAFSLGFFYNYERPVWWLESDEAGEYRFDFRIVMSGNIGGSQPPLEHFTVASNAWDLYFQKNDDTAALFTKVNVITIPATGFGYTIYTYSVTLDLNVGDRIRVYGIEIASLLTKLTIWGVGEAFYSDGGIDNESIANITQFEIPSYFDVEADTVFPISNCQSFLIHDAGGQITDRITGQDGSFYSEVLGSDQTIYRQYDSEGCFWNYAEAKGLQIRRYSLIEKPFFQSFKQWWEGVNPIFNLGLGYELYNGQQVIRVEDKRHFYDDSEVSLNISNVRDIVRKYDDNRLFKAIRIGYKKWQAEDVSGIDDPQTKKTYASRLQKSGKDITIESDFIAASLAIETTRRKTREKSADYRFDNDTFIIAIRPDPIDISPETSPNVTDYDPELDENFDSITNLLNAETRYNSKLTPARNFIRWRDWLSAGLQPYPTDPFKFTSGEGNYDMASQIIPILDGCVEYSDMLSEKQDLEISTDPFHLAFLYEISFPLTWEEYKLIRENKKKAIGISQTEENHIKFFINDLSYTPDKGEVVVSAWPVELMSILPLESTATGQLCFTDCGDSYLTEDSFEYETEDEECLILN